MSETTSAHQQSGFVGSIARFNWRAYGMIIALLVIAIIFNILTDGIFLSSRNLAQLMRQSSVLIVVATGVAVLIIQREIDLSIGSAVYLTGLAAAFAQTQWGLGTVEALACALVIGLVIGCWQGFWVSWVGIPSFVVTLAGLLGLRGAGYVWSDAATYAPMNSSYVAISESFISETWSVILIVGFLLVFGGYTTWRWAAKRRRFGAEAIPLGRLVKPNVFALCGAAIMLYAALGFRGIPMAVVVALAMAGILSFVTLGTVFGRQLYAIGGNREAAFLSGINIRRNLFFSFVIMGVVYAVAGVLTTARLNAIAPAVGEFLELEAIAAAVIGGISLGGGIGTVYGAIVGALLLVVVDNGMSLMNVSSFIQLVVKALLLGFAVWFDIATRPGGRRWH